MKIISFIIILMIIILIHLGITMKFTKKMMKEIEKRQNFVKVIFLFLLLLVQFIFCYCLCFGLLYFILSYAILGIHQAISIACRMLCVLYSIAFSFYLVIEL